MSGEPPKMAQCLPLWAFLGLLTLVTVVFVALFVWSWFDGRRVGRVEQAEITGEELDRAWTSGWDTHEALVRSLGDAAATPGRDVAFRRMPIIGEHGGSVVS